ncbi:OmpA family protein [Roseovarius sp. ZX-A-9]|uniref:OmpA family protein n=1 Tax=Roseovarius sp. ZX-A-9 TaxID=3014783 RepID=UPI00232BDAC5|nr:OmpA family protein [Roseovarius sp. ZX-A-9]
MKKTIIFLSVLALGACSKNTGQVYRSYFDEAGSLVDNGSFGNANMNNMQIMNGEKSYVHDLSSRFATEVLSTVNFAFNSAQLDAAARETLREQAAWIKQFPEVRFRVYGHTDAVGSNAFNKRLGLARANAVVGYLSSQGISRSRLEAVVSYGETQPLIVTEGRERRNRRTVTEVSGFVRSNPIVMEGKYAEIVFREYVTSAKPESELPLAKGSGSTTSEE